MVKVDKKTTKEKGDEFEKKVATWVKTQWHGTKKLTVKTNQFARGFAAKNPFQIDVHVRDKGKDWQDDTWIECKRGKANRDIVYAMVGKALEIKKAHKKGISDFDFDHLMIVSAKEFPDDTINAAIANEVACVYYDGRSYNTVNDGDWWQG